MKLYDLIKQEFLGRHVGFESYFKKNKNFYYQIYKNPKTFKRLSNGVRGIIDNDGNIFIVQQVDDHGDNINYSDEKIIHYDIVKILYEHDLFTKYGDIINDNKYYKDIQNQNPHTLHHICIQNFNGIIYPGESYGGVFVHRFKSQFEQYFNKASLKNPNLKFKLW